jgi:polysaccharide chain length determinant protein (PEP-CTERM system associated)
VLPGKTYSPEDVLAIAWRRRWILLMPFAISAAATAVFSWTLPDRYRSETVILVVPQRIPEAYVRSTVTAPIEDRLQSISPQIMSRTRLERIILDFNLYAKDRKVLPMEEIVERMRQDVTVSVVKGDAFRVAYIGERPRTVADVANRLASLFIEENLRDRAALAAGTDQFLEAQLEDARQRLIVHEKKLEAFRKEHAGQLPSQLETNLQIIQNTQMQIRSIDEALNRDRDRRLLLERTIAELSRSAADTTNGPALGGSQEAASGTMPLSGQLRLARVELADLESRLTPEHPDVGRTKRRIRDLEAKVAAGVEEQPLSGDPEQGARVARIRQLHAEISSLDRQIGSRDAEQKRLQGVVAAYQTRVEAAPSRETEMTELMRDYSTLQAVYSSLLGKKEDSKMSANLERRQVGGQFKLLDPAVPAERPFTPDRLRLLLVAAIVGLGLGLGWAALLEYRDGSLWNDEEASMILSVPVLATVPIMLTEQERRRRSILGWSVNLAGSAVICLCGAIVTWTILMRPAP